jgi:hypothetical protein
VVHGHGGDGRRRRTVHHVGRVVAAAEAGFQHQQVGGHAAEQQEGRGGGDLEDGDLRAGVAFLHLGQHVLQRLLLDERAGQADALVKRTRCGEV